MGKSIGHRVPTTLMAVGLVCLGLVIGFLSRWDIQITTERVPPQDSLPGNSGVLPAPQEPATRGASLRSPISSTSVPPAPAFTSPLPSAIASPESDLAPLPEGTRQGKLRISNPTPYPVRVALLPQKAAALASDPPPEVKLRSPYSQATHWDFAPGEGQQKGLPVSLPNGQQTFNSGDILFVFAQDGSQRYWGPYVIDRTPQPQWNEGAQEWELQLQL